MHRKESNIAETTGSNELDNYVSSLNSLGQPLSESSRQFFEPRFGQDFSNVKIHTDSVAAKSAQSINALAYTTGNNIVFNHGQYSPNSESGQKLMAHELTHVVQQGNLSLNRNVQASPDASPAKTKAAPKPRATAQGFNGTTTGPYIQSIEVIIHPKSKSVVTLKWANADKITGLPTTLHASPGAGLCSTDCSDVAKSKVDGSHCTPLGKHTILGYAKSLSGYPTATHVSWIDMNRAIAFHYFNVPDYPASHGCIRMSHDELGAEWIQNNTIKNVTEVIINWAPGEPVGAKCWEGKKMSTRPPKKASQTPHPAPGPTPQPSPAPVPEVAINRKEKSISETQVSNELDNYVSTLSSSGQPLSESSRQFFEPPFGQDFSHVKVHTDSVAAKSAQSINALAYTTGNNIVFNHGQYSPNSESGQRLMAHELTHVVQQNYVDTARKTIMRDTPPSPPSNPSPSPGPSPTVRIPSLEIAAMQYGGLGKTGYPLSPERIAIAREIFGSSIIYQDVQIVESSVIAAPTTLGNNIRIPPGSNLDNSTLIHELTHIWQFQNHGSSYISNSLTHQLASILATGDRNAAYNYTLLPDKDFTYYTAEQQAMIVEDYYRQPANRTNPLYQKLIAQVRAATPSSMTSMDKYNEALNGPAYNNPYFLNPPESNTPNNPGGSTVPIVRIEF